MLAHFDRGAMPGPGALKWTARSLEAIDNDEGLWTFDCLPRFMRTEKQIMYRWLHP